MRELHVQVARLDALDARLDLLQGARDEVGEGQVDDDQAHDQHAAEEDDVLDHGALLAVHVHVERNDDADGAAHVAGLPPLLGVTGHVDLAGRLAVAVEAVLLDAHGSRIAEHLFALEFGDLVELAAFGIGVERVERDGLELVGLVGGVARVEVHEARGVGGLRGE